MNHPGLLHLHVHLMEMSSHPEAALVTGDRLRELTPDMGHLVHMPTPIDVQCGQYRDAMHWNQKAIIADRKFYEVVRMRPLCEPHGVGKGVVPRALVVNEVTLRITGRQCLDQRAFGRADTVYITHDLAAAYQVSDSRSSGNCITFSARLCDTPER